MGVKIQLHAYITSIRAKYHTENSLLMLRNKPQLSSLMSRYYTTITFLCLYYKFVFSTPNVVLVTVIKEFLLTSEAGS
jgi:hypothetical protein